MRAGTTIVRAIVGWLGLATLAMAPGFASASIWFPLPSKPGSPAFMDVESIKYYGEAVSIWHRNNYDTPQDMPGHKPHLSRHALIEINCRTRTFKTIGLVFYARHDGLGERVGQMSFADETRESALIEPDTQIEVVRRFVCDKTK